MADQIVQSESEIVYVRSWNRGLVNASWVQKKIIEFLYEIIPTSMDDLYITLQQYFGYITNYDSTNTIKYNTNFFK